MYNSTIKDMEALMGENDRKIKLDEVAILAETLSAKEISNAEGVFIKASKDKDKTHEEEEK